MSNVQFVVLAGIGGVCALLLILIVLILIAFRPFRLRWTDARIAGQIDAAVERLGESVQHYVDVNAVLALTEQFKERPELVERLPEYSRQVVAAALLARVNAIGNDIKLLQEARRKSESTAINYPDDHRHVDRLSARLIELYDELEAANQAVEAFSAVPV